MKPVFKVLIPSLLSFTSASASELVIKDIYLGFELLPTDFEFDNKSDLSSNSGDDEYDASFATTIGALYSWSSPGSSSGWIAGGEANLRQQEITSDSDMTSIGVRGILGYAYAYNDRFTFAFEPFLGFGYSDFTVTDSLNIDGFDMDGFYFEYGFKAKTIMSMNDRWKAHFGIGYAITETSLDGGPDGFQSDLTASGLCFSLGIAYRWNTAPWTLE